MKNRSHQVLEEVYINSGTLSVLLCFLSGYFLGTGSYLIGGIITVIYFVLDNVNTRLWLKVFNKKFK